MHSGVRNIAVLLFILGLIGCGSLSTRLTTVHDMTRVESDANNAGNSGSSDCREQLNYAPDPDHLDHTPIRYVRVNVHFMDEKTGMHNLNEADGIQYARDVINGCNYNLANNIKMNLPLGNDTPVLPTQYRLKLTGVPGDPNDDGIYFHEDPELFYYIHGRNTNRNDRTVLRKYEIQPDTVINIFLMPHHPDSIGRPGYRNVDTGIMLGGCIKIARHFSRGPRPKGQFGLTNHEIGHIIGLSHAWRNTDGCDDTPVHSNCYMYNDEPPCDTAVSNNMMDYNLWQHALTPCQLGRAHRQFANEQSRVRKFLEPTWCEPIAEPLIIEDSIQWNSAKDLSSDIIIKNGAVLLLNCRLSLAKGRRITVEPKGRLIIDGAQLHNACGDEWYGIEVQEKGKNSGQVVLLTEPEIENCTNPLPLEEAQER